jgi:predicted lipid carrier protein YhbT
MRRRSTLWQGIPQPGRGGEFMIVRDAIRAFAPPPLRQLAEGDPRALLPPPALLRRLPPPPLAPLQPLLRRVVTDIARRHPRLFARLGDNARRRFLVDVEELPFVLLLQPRPSSPTFRAFHRHRIPEHDVRIAGAFAALFRLLDSEADSDALFFSRDIVVEGNTEAIVALRNAIDDLEGPLTEEVAAAFGPLAGILRRLLVVLRAMFGEERP